MLSWGEGGVVFEGTVEAEESVAVPTVREIQRVVARWANIPATKMSDPCRQRVFARPRQIAMYLSRELTTHSYPAIGRLFGDRDHTTVLYAYRKLRDEAAREPNVAELLDRMRQQITSEVKKRPPVTPVEIVLLTNPTPPSM